MPPTRRRRGNLERPRRRALRQQRSPWHQGVRDDFYSVIYRPVATACPPPSLHPPRGTHVSLRSFATSNDDAKMFLFNMKKQLSETEGGESDYERIFTKDYRVVGFKDKL